MINFIICDDNSYVRNTNERIISKITMPYDFEYVVHSFEKYDDRMKEIINTPSDIKIYILDLEMPGISGLEVARKIRKVDWNSIIIVLTSHDELEMKMLKQKLLIFDFISKFDDYEQSLTDSINMVIKKFEEKKTLNFKHNKELHNVKYDNILYIQKDADTGKTKVVTPDKEYYVRTSLSKLKEDLDYRFVQVHRACFVNLNKITKVDFKNNIVHFEGEKFTDYISRNYKKNLNDIKKQLENKQKNEAKTC